MVVIAISGQPGSGKTTVAKEIARVLGLRLRSSGVLFRELAKRYGMELIEFHKYAEAHPEIDREVDAMAVEEAKMGDAVLEGHLTAWVVRPYADICIYLKGAPEVRARRVALRDGRTFEEALREIIEREELNRRRYKQIYNIDIADLAPFDLVIDTTYLSQADVVRITLDFVCTALSAKFSKNLCASGRR
ncbi:cytidylate kinase [Thermoproteus uzoniensis 768-20]|uniref:Cytidylate kinase n=1 Tax=Thermoproteus uzoniensis (strain 768-20) TaxID=999630 RepID=F2L232_THEU7|nr:AAA family ATPase [Thermoproteus uzoniensis]AEA12959.1 cytidylate kinase [Thermoproteus uzoniensis 768-20]